MICVSRRMSVAQRVYAQTLRKALSVYWAVYRLYKFLFGENVAFFTHHEALEFIFHPDKSLAKSFAERVHQWSVALNAH